MTLEQELKELVVQYQKFVAGENLPPNYQSPIGPLHHAGMVMATERVIQNLQEILSHHDHPENAGSRDGCASCTPQSEV